MARWPNVPAVFGWLELGQRGEWRIRGEPLRHKASLRFIRNNYACDEKGRWFFQNGPQRVFVVLDYMPLVLRLDSGTRLVTHCGASVERLEGVWLDERGGLLFATEHGPGSVDDRDLAALLEYFRDASGNPCDDDVLESLLECPAAAGAGALRFEWSGALVPVSPICSATVEEHFGFDAHPVEPDQPGEAG